MIQPFVPQRAHFHSLAVVIGAPPQARVDVHIYSTPDGRGEVCSHLGLAVNSNAFTNVEFDRATCTFSNPKAVYYLQVFNASGGDVTLYLVDNIGGGNQDNAYTSDMARYPTPTTTSMRCVIYTQY